MKSRLFSEPDQSGLVEAACLGDKQAIDDLLLAYQPTITRFARKYCETPQDVEDAVQETLWIASQKIGTLRVSVAVVSWFFRIVRNYCFRLLKTAHNDYWLDGEPELPGLLSDPDIERQADLQQDLIQALSRLPTTYREVVLLRDVQGLTAAETAATLGLTVETVKARLHRARHSLRDMLVQWQE